MKISLFFFSYIHEHTQMTCALFQQMHCTNQCISMRWYAIPIWQLDVYSGKKSHFIFFFMFVLHFLIFPFQWLYHCFCAVYMLFKFSTLLLELKLKESRSVPFPNILTLDQLGAHCSNFYWFTWLSSDASNLLPICLKIRSCPLSALFIALVYGNCSQ